MKKLVCTLITLVLVLVALSGCGKGAANTATATPSVAPTPTVSPAPTATPVPTATPIPTNTYESSEYKYSLSYPIGWTKTEASGMVVLASASGSSANVIVTPGVSLSEFTKDALQTELSAALAGLTISDYNAKDTFGGKDAVSVKYSVTSSGVTLNGAQYYVAMGTSVCIITFTQLSTDTAAADGFKTITSSFQFK